MIYRVQEHREAPFSTRPRKFDETLVREVWVDAPSPCTHFTQHDTYSQARLLSFKS